MAYCANIVMFRSSGPYNRGIHFFEGPLEQKILPMAVEDACGLFGNLHLIPHLRSMLNEALHCVL